MAIDRRLSTTGIFLGALLALVLYLLAVRSQVSLPVPVFFGAIALMIGALLYQVLALASPGFTGIILAEITTVALVFHYIYQIPTYSLYGSDAYYDMASLKAIMESGRIGGVTEYVQITSFFPMIHTLGAEISLITGIEALAVAKWFPAIVGTATIPLIYLLVRHLFKNQKAALLAALLYASMQHYVLFGSLFVRETIALALAVSCVYLYVAARSSGHSLAYRSLALLFLGGTVLAHHLTSVMLISLLAFYWAFTALARAPGPGRLFFRGTTGESVSFSLLLMAIIATLAYWITTVTESVQLLTMFVNNVFTPSGWGIRTILQRETAGVLPGMRYYFLIYGSYISYAVFGLILLYKSFSRQGRRFIETPVFTAYLVLCGLIGVMSFYFLPPTVGGDRFLAFGWLFAFGPLALAIIEFRNKIAAYFSVAIVLFFIFVNLYTIHPTVWDPMDEGAGGAAQKEDFALAATLDFPREDILGYMNNIMTIYEVQNTMGTDAFFVLDAIDFKDYEWLIVNRASLKEQGLYSEFTRKLISEMARLEARASTNYARVYESPNIAVLRLR